jgi:hypothetical protein
MQESIEQRRDGGGITEQLPQSATGRLDALVAVHDEGSSRKRDAPASTAVATPLPAAKPTSFRPASSPLMK